MKTLSASEARNAFSDIIKRAHFGNEAIIIENHGEDYAAIIDADLFKALIAPERIEELKKFSSGEWETLEILSQKDNVKTIIDGLKEIAENRTEPIESILE